MNKLQPKNNLCFLDHGRLCTFTKNCEDCINYDATEATKAKCSAKLIQAHKLIEDSGIKNIGVNEEFLATKIQALIVDLESSIY